MNEIPWDIITGLGVVLAGTAWGIYYILRLAYLETKNEEE